MMPSHRNCELSLCLLAVACLLPLAAFSQTNVILRLKNGDRLLGNILSESTNEVVIATSWAKELRVPLSEIEKRELSPASTNIVAAVTTNAPATTAAAKPATNAPAATTNIVAAATPPQTKPAPPPQPKRWKANVQMGTDLLFGKVDRQLYYGQFDLTYAEPYKSDPKQFFRTTLGYRADYGRTDGTESTDRMNGSLKMDFDIGKRFYVYGLGTVGYDHVRLIDLYYQAGPGLGYHLFTEPKYVMNTELGLNYQAENRAAGADTRNVYGRAAENFTWTIYKKVTLSHKFEFFPNLQELGEFRARGEATLSLPLLDNLSLNFIVVDIYDTKPAPTVNNNEMQVRSTIGVSF